MNAYRHNVQYYETDKMGIVHHSNYIRWMEEARIDFLRQIGWNYERLEALGIISPVVSVDCHYKAPTTFGDVIDIEVSVAEYKGVKLILSYTMSDQKGQKVCTAGSVHCFVNKEGRPIRIAKQFPDFDQLLKNLVEGTEK